MISETFETAITWDRFEAFHREVMDAAEGAVRSASEWLPAKSLEEAIANPVKGQTLPRRD